MPAGESTLAGMDVLVLDVLGGVICLMRLDQVIGAGSEMKLPMTDI